MDIEGGDEALVVQLVQIGLVRDVADLYRLKADELLQLQGMNGKLAQQFIDAIRLSKSHDLWQLLLGFGIPHVGVETAKALARNFRDLDQLRGASFEQVKAVEGIDDVIARSVVHWFGDSDNRQLIKRLQKAGVNFDTSLQQERTG